MIARKLSDENIEPPSSYNKRNIKKTYTTNLWGLSTINQILSNPIYIGNLVQRKFDKVSYKSKKKIKLNKDQWIVIENAVEPIISKEIFEKVQEMKSKNVANCNKKYDYLLKGLVVCGDCGRIMTVRRMKFKRKYKEDSIETYYCCTNNIRYRNGVCSLHYFNEEKLNKIVIDYLRNILKRYSNKDEMQTIYQEQNKNVFSHKDFEKEKETYIQKRNILKKALKDLYVDKTNDIISEVEFVELKQDLEKDKEILDNKINEIKETIEKNERKTKNQQVTLDKINEFLSFKNPNKQILLDLIKKIEIMENKQIKVYLNFNIKEEKQYE